MSKISFSKLKLKVDDSVNTVEIEGADGTIYEIEVKQYLPIENKIKLVSYVIAKSANGGVIREDMLDAYLGVELVKEYTNFSFTEKMLQNDADLFDVLESNDIVGRVQDAMNPAELEDIIRYINSYSDQMQKSIQSSVSGYTAQEKAIEGMVAKFMSEIVSNESETVSDN